MDRDFDREPPDPPGDAEVTEAGEGLGCGFRVGGRKILGWKTPAEVFEEQLRSVQEAGVASTG
jgi:hypothetical protein